MSKNYLNLIGGRRFPANSGKTYEDRNPADTSDIVGTFPLSDASDVRAAVAAARQAYGGWRRMPAPKRGEIMRRAAELMVARKEELARIMTREMGKVLKETRGDVQEGIDTAFFAFGESRRLHGRTVPSELPNKTCMVYRQPIGVWGIISPWNFPMAIPTWKIFPALTCGNTVVFKPATDTPATAGEFVDILCQAGVPDGVVNIVYGTGSAVGEALINDPDIQGISFTGSSTVGKRIAQVCGQTLKRCSLELGGKNAQIVMNDADFDLALEGVLWGAFGTTGQRCTATSRLILQAGIHDRFLARLVERAQGIRVGNGLDETVEMGPCINQAQRQVVHDYVQIGIREGARLMCGGKFLTGEKYDRGWFYAPTVFADVQPRMRIAREEIFGPVLSVLKVNDLTEAIRVLNDTVYGLSSSIYTRNVNDAFLAIQEIEAGITYVNAPTIGAECHLPFGGVKETGNGHREGGWTAFDIFTELKTVYVDYSGGLQKAQIDTWESK